jgi:hypothetical protein
MFDYLRNLTKSAEEKQQEALNAYLDDALSPKERQQFEQQFAADADLRQAVEQRRALQMQMRQMPRRRVPRNFTLDPAVYGRPQRQPLFQLYPAMRVAAVLTAFFFILAISADLFLPGQGGMTEMSASQDVAMVAEEVMEAPAAEAPSVAQVVEVTRFVTETVVEEGEPVMAEAAPMLEAPAEEAMAETADFAEEESMPAADTAANDAAEIAGGAEPELAATVPLPTPTSAATLTTPAVDATKSTLPRPEAETVTGERAMTAVPAPQTEAFGGAEATAVPLSQPKQAPISVLRWLQIGLGVLLVVLGTAVFYVRRQTF